MLDHSKFGRTGSVQIGAIAEVSAVVTDKALPPAMRRLLRGRGVKVVVAKSGVRGLVALGGAAA